MTAPAPRFPLEFTAVLRFGGPTAAARAPIPVRTQNMSMKGLCLVLDEATEGSPPLPRPGEMAEVVLTLGDGPEERKIQMAVRIVWIRDHQIGAEVRLIQGKGQALYESLLHGYQTLFGFNPLQFPASRAA